MDMVMVSRLGVSNYRMLVIMVRHTHGEGDG